MGFCVAWRDRTTGAVGKGVMVGNAAVALRWVKDSERELPGWEFWIEEVRLPEQK